VILAPRGAHSAKPDAAYRLIESLCPGPYFELYARRQWSEKWRAWGDQLVADAAERTCAP
jgi:N6-adenosine-specific RNA methylase IME4